MRKTSTGMFQVGYVDNWEYDKKAMDIAVGSGRKDKRIYTE